MARLQRFLTEARRRHVFRVAIVYAAVAFVIVEAGDLLVPALLLPAWTYSLLVLLAILGFPIALVLAWAFELTPSGILRKEPADDHVPENGSVAAEPRGEPGSDEGSNAIAVLPFVNLSADPENEYFSDGITEELIGALAGVEGLRVAARTSVFAYKGRSEDVREIGRHLGVGTLLEGSVRKYGNRFRISTQLVEASDGYQLWSETYDREVGDIFATQQEISRAIVATLRKPLGLSARDPVLEPGTADVAAYSLYLKGRYHLNKRTRESLVKAIESFERAVEADPRYALAHSGLADVYLLLERYGVLAPGESIPRAKAAAARALEIDPSLAAPHASLAYAKMIGDWDRDGAEAEFRRAIELDPRYAPAHHWYAWFLSHLGRFDEAMTEIERALALEPLALITNANRGTVLYFSRRFDEAEGQLRSTLDLDPNFVVAHQWRGRTLEALGRHRDAVQAHQRALDLQPGDPESVASLGHALGMAGEREEARRLQVRLDELARDRYVSPYWRGLLYMGLGETESALTALEEAYEDRFDWLLFLGVDPIFDGLRDDRRFAQLVRLIERTGPNRDGR